MDPFSTEGELINIHSTFHQGQFQSVVDFDTSSLSPSNALPARILKLRARIELCEHDAVLSEISSEAKNTPDLAAVQAFAQFDKSRRAGKEDAKAIAQAEKLSKDQSDNLTVQLLCGTVLAESGQKEEAIALLNKHQGSLDAVALLTQIHLSQYRLDLAQAVVKQARSFAQDSLLINIAESWVGLRQGGSEKYQSAFYVYEEMATAPSTLSLRNVLGQAICEVHLGRLPEAEAAMGQVLSTLPEGDQNKDGQDNKAISDALANGVVLNTIAGRASEAEALKQRLMKRDPQHPFVKDLEAKRALFASAREKYKPKFEIEGEA